MQIFKCNFPLQHAATKNHLYYVCYEGSIDINSLAPSNLRDVYIRSDFCVEEYTVFNIERRYCTVLWSTGKNKEEEERDTV